MKIVSTFIDELYAVHYPDKEQNELNRLLELWNDTAYIYQFLKDNHNDLPKQKTYSKIAVEIINAANEIDETLREIDESESKLLKYFFKPLDNNEYHEVILSKQKGRNRYLRLYALRIEENTFLITGGAIKFTHLMQDRPHTQRELDKIRYCRQYLREERVMDSDSFYEFLTEQL